MDHEMSKRQLALVHFLGKFDARLVETCAIGLRLRNGATISESSIKLVLAMHATMSSRSELVSWIVACARHPLRISTYGIYREDIVFVHILDSAIFSRPGQWLTSRSARVGAAGTFRGAIATLALFLPRSHQDELEQQDPCMDLRGGRLLPVESWIPPAHAPPLRSVDVFHAPDLSESKLPSVAPDAF